MVNPTKVDDLKAAQALLAEVCQRHGWHEPNWVETTEDETGERQSRDAVAAGADVVASLGGDGTVRAVAAGLVGTDVALGLLPAGTGNLLARNLGLPIDSLDQAAEAMVGGSQHRIDVGLVRPGVNQLAVADGQERADDEEVFLVMCGLGLDGEVMAGTNEKIKGVLGWPAYAIAAAKRLGGRGFVVKVDHARSEDTVVRHCRTVLVGNCGTLQGGVELMPDARPDDGILDLVVVAPQGPFGWLSVVGAVATRGRIGHRRLDRLRSTAFTVVAKRPVEAEIDGDPIGEHRALAVRVLPDALVVRSG
ncbi:diacylglycerol kinase [Humibacillus sp. DSM 29435]|nr:diacylglycerol kinase [Humibacillus sp. DSM 29435]